MTKKWEYADFCGNLLVVDGNGNGDVVAELSNPNDEESARLMAAAPKMYELLKRYRNETPLGNQPHMIANDVDDLFLQIEGD